MVARNVTSLRNNYLLFNSTFPATDSIMSTELGEFLIFMLGDPLITLCNQAFRAKPWCNDHCYS